MINTSTTKMKRNFTFEQSLHFILIVFGQSAAWQLASFCFLFQFCIFFLNKMSQIFIFASIFLLQKYNSDSDETVNDTITSDILVKIRETLMLMVILPFWLSSNKLQMSYIFFYEIFFFKCHCAYICRDKLVFHVLLTIDATNAPSSLNNKDIWNIRRALSFRRITWITFFQFFFFFASDWKYLLLLIL